MPVTIVHIKVKPEAVDAFIQATAENHRGSVQETGNLRFDFLQSSEDPTQFVLYEAYRSSDDKAAHKNTPHYLKWRETVASMMAEPRNGVPYELLLP
ncbi:MAG: antibiotic biosynthesis monooxygenase [Spirochaeta sp.]